MSAVTPVWVFSITIAAPGRILFSVSTIRPVTIPVLGAEEAGTSVFTSFSLVVETSFVTALAAGTIINDANATA